MHPESPDGRILAIAIRSQRFGFAVIEGPNWLLDWGVVSYPRNKRVRVAAARKRVASLLTQFVPSVVVVGKSHLLNVRNTSGVRSTLKSIRRETSLRFIPLHVMQQADVRNTFRDFHAKSKDEVAVVLARMFPELLWKVPPKRKIWQSEHPRMPVFDAVALGVAYWQLHSSRDPTPE